MKKAYTKPEVAFFDFTLSTSIAVGCEEKTKLPTEGACGWKPDERWPNVIFNVGTIEQCTAGVSGSGYDTLCYHVPTEAYNLFAS